MKSYAPTVEPWEREGIEREEYVQTLKQSSVPDKLPTAQLSDLAHKIERDGTYRTRTPWSDDETA